MKYKRTEYENEVNMRYKRTEYENQDNMTREKVQKQRRVWVQATRWVWQSGLISTRYRRDHHCRFHGQPKQGGVEGLSNLV